MMMIGGLTLGLLAALALGRRRKTAAVTFDDIPSLS